MKKEWIIWGVIGLLAVALVVGVVVLTNATNNMPVPPQETQPITESLTQGDEETTGQTQGTTIPEEETTVPEDTTTVPEVGTKPQENTDHTEEPTKAPEKETEGNGFGERDPVKPTKPPKQEETKPTEQEQTKPSQGETTSPTQPESTTPTTKEEMTYRAYLALTTEEQIEFQETFPSRNAFKQWYLAAKKAYEDAQNKVTMGPGNSVDLEDYFP